MPKRNPFHTPNAGRVTFAGDPCPPRTASQAANAIFAAMRAGDIPSRVFALYAGSTFDVHDARLGTFDVHNETGEHIATFF